LAMTVMISIWSSSNAVLGGIEPSVPVTGSPLM